MIDVKFAPKLTEQGGYCLTFTEHVLSVRLCWELSSQQSQEMERLWERRGCAQNGTAKWEPGLNLIFHLFPKSLSLLLTHKTCPWIPVWQTSVDPCFGAISKDLLSVYWHGAYPLWSDACISLYVPSWPNHAIQMYWRKQFQDDS